MYQSVSFDCRLLCAMKLTRLWQGFGERGQTRIVGYTRLIGRVWVAQKGREV